MSNWKTMNARFAPNKVDEIRMDSATNTMQVINFEHHQIHDNEHYFLEDFVTLGNGVVFDFCVTTADNDAWVHLVFSYSSTLAMQFDLYEGSSFAADGTLTVQRGNHRARCSSGTHTAAGNHATIMTDSAAAFVVDALIGWKIYNVTDGSFGIVTDNDETTVTVASLSGGTDDDWDTADEYEINQSLADIFLDCTVNSTGTRLGGSLGGSGSNPATGVPGGSTRENELILRPNTSYLFRFTSGAASNDFSYNAEWYENTNVVH